MTAQVEQEPKPQVPEEVAERPPVPEVPPELERATGVRVRPVQPAGQVTDDTGKPLTQVAATPAVTVTVPASQQQLNQWSTGAPNLSLTWLANFWLRIMKKALHFGWRIVTKGGGGDAAV